MRIRLTMATITAMTIAGAITINAQAPQQPPQTPPPQPQAKQPQAQPQTQPPAERQRPMTDADRATTMGQVIMITGCLKNEKDVPGLKPNVAERAGVGEDYILNDVKMSSSSKVAGIALASRYEIHGIDSDDLKKHIDHQIELTGTIDPNPAHEGEAPNFTATSLKMLSATCSPQ